MLGHDAGELHAHRIPVEEDKTSAEKGNYIHPELFGHPDDPSIGAAGHAADRASTATPKLQQPQTTQP